MTKSGPEAIVEFFYKAMNAQQQNGCEQNNKILVARTKLAKHLPECVLTMPNTTKLIARHFLAKHPSVRLLYDSCTPKEPNFLVVKHLTNTKGYVYITD